MNLSTRCQKFSNVCQEIAEVEEKLAELKAKKKALSDQLVEAMTNEGVEKMTLDQGEERATFYIYKNLWAKLSEGLKTEDGIAALKKAKLDQLLHVSYNASQLSSFLREREKEGKPLPKPLVGVFQFNPSFEIRVKTSGG